MNMSIKRITRRNKEGIHLNIQDHLGDGLLQAWTGAGEGRAA